MSQHFKSVIIHVDIDCFYAQVEMVNNPHYKEVPIGILQNQTISTTNYVAREFGLSKMIHVNKAKQICPSLIIIPARMDTYQLVSSKIFEECIQEKISTFHGECKMQVCGIDEAFIDVSEEVKYRMSQKEEESNKELIIGKKVSLLSSDKDVALNIASQIAKEIRDEVFDKHGYTLSAGIAHSKLLAKLASKKDKPNGQTVIYSNAFDQELNDLDVSAIPNIGYQTKEKLSQLCNIKTVREFRKANALEIKKCFHSEKIAIRALRIANGKYDEEYDPVVEQGPVSSIGSSLTFLPIDSYEEVNNKLYILALDLNTKIKRDMTKNNQRYATLLTLKYSFGSYKEKYQSVSTRIDKTCYTSINGSEIQKKALELFKQKIALPFQLYRICIIVSDFQGISSNPQTKQGTKRNTLDPKQKSITSFFQVKKPKN
ncbi:hypothetical protein ABK040_001506 [Willaertia magna]